MANETASPGLEKWQEQSSPPEDCPLISILADMLRSAQAWEEEHGEPVNCQGDRQQEEGKQGDAHTE